ncbi:MAG TPA: hypothetical protein VFC78_01740 [Tepidisphaeraceae bacterium]|nr:hypothetical protein [Tepidisphaeraceae bacterium]
MRLYMAGIFILILSSAAMGQVGGEILGVGPGGNEYRPGCWTPLVVKLHSTVSEPMTYQLQIWQEDLDKDHVVYTKDVTLSPQATESYMLYFVPSPVEDPLKGLRVRVCLPPAEGRKPDDAKVVVERLSMAFTPANLDPSGNGMGSRIGQRVVLWVGDGSSYPSFNEYQKSIGLTADVNTIAVRPTDLGENVLFYDSVDAVIWLDANADELDEGGAKRLAALEEYVRQGGNLVVCQPNDLPKIAALAPMLPVETKDAGGNWLISIAEKPSFADFATNPKDTDIRDALPELAKQKNPEPLPDDWHLIPGPIKMARATPRDGAIVDFWEQWKKGDRTPYIVRQPYGLGCVTWVAQDLGEQKLIGKYSRNWPYVWDRVLGWHNDTRTSTDAPADSKTGSYADRQHKMLSDTGGTVDLARWMLKGTDFGAKGAAYIVLAILFFLAYWLAAGPGTYLFLARKKRRELNWFIFGAWAFVGTFITVLVVRLVLRGDAEMMHLTLARSTPGEPSYVYSRAGLYIPRDGDQTIALGDTARDGISYITPLQLNHIYAQSTDFPAAQVYSIPVHDDPQPVSVRIPFRSTMQKLQTRWVGDLPNGISGAGHLKAFDKGVIDGSLTNQTGTLLKNVYIVFNYPMPDGKTRQDMVLFIPALDDKKTIDLGAEYAKAKTLSVPGMTFANAADPRNHDANIKGQIDRRWDEYWSLAWSSDLHGMGGGDDDLRGESDYTQTVPRGFPILSLFDRIGPGHNTNESFSRVNFIRRGGRCANMSPAVAAGKMVVLAQSDDDLRPLPYPLTVEGSRVEGKGRVLYQFALPIDRSELEKTWR